jgi:8-oxo-dGTP diphosphatase
MTSSPKKIHVVAGALFDDQGLVLIAQRPAGKHMAGGWEFPGGKLNVDEAPYDGLCRELHEELGIDVRDAEPVIAYTHDYGDRQVFLDLWRITRFEGAPTSVEGQPLQWVRIDQLESVGLLEADMPMIAALKARPLIAEESD